MKTKKPYAQPKLEKREKLSDVTQGGAQIVTGGRRPATQPTTIPD